jgi:hypothetical protein
MASKECIALLKTTIDEGPVRIIIDALDECDDYRQLLNALKVILANGRAKLLVSGRPDADIKPYFTRLDKVSLNSELCGNDMATFVVQEVKGKEDHERILEGRHPELEDELVSVLLEKAGGM